jgi:hypothetical protein
MDSWAHIHQNVGQLCFIPHEVLMAKPLTINQLDWARWSIVGDAFLFFIFLGLSSEARQGYKWVFRQTLQPLSIKASALKSKCSRWCVYFIVLRSHRMLFTVSLVKSLRKLVLDRLEADPEPTVPPTVCTTFDITRPTSGADDKPNSSQTKQDTMKLAVYDLGSQDQ